MQTQPLTSNASQGVSSNAASRAAASAQQTLANRLADRMGLAPGSLSGPANDFAPDKVANRLLSFIEQRLQGSAGDKEALGGLLQQARAGIEKGFNEATKILEGMGVLQGKVAEDIGKTRSLLDKGMQDLEKRYLGNVANSPPASTNTSVGAYAERFAARLDTFDLEVTTRGGDRLRISIAEGAAAWSQQAVQVNEDGSSQAASRSGSLQMGRWQIEVEGELDAEEREALGELLGQVEELSASFYAGDLNGAFDQALALRLDGDQLASMSLSLTQTQVRQVSESYGSVAREGGKMPSAVNSDLIDYARGLMDALRSADTLSEDGKGFLERLLEGGLALDGRLDEEGFAKAGRLNSLLLDGLAGQAKEQAPSAS